MMQERTQVESSDRQDRFSHAMLREIYEQPQSITVVPLTPELLLPEFPCADRVHGRQFCGHRALLHPWPEEENDGRSSPALGFLICLLLWVNLSWPAKTAGTIWMAAGIAFGAWKTGGFRRGLIDFEVPAS